MERIVVSELLQLSLKLGYALISDLWPSLAYWLVVSLFGVDFRLHTR